jgi:hypothetical protein
LFLKSMLTLSDNHFQPSRPHAMLLPFYCRITAPFTILRVESRPCVSHCRNARLGLLLTVVASSPLVRNGTVPQVHGHSFLLSSRTPISFLSLGDNVDVNNLQSMFFANVTFSAGVNNSMSLPPCHVQFDLSLVVLHLFALWDKPSHSPADLHLL